MVGNEARHDLFAAAIANLGGTYLGVGGEQNYTLAALADVSHLIVIDYDPQVIALHRELGTRITQATSPEQFLADLADAHPAETTLQRAWPTVVTHLQRLLNRSCAANKTWLCDPTLYARCRSLWLSGRVYLVLGDLAGESAMASVAHFARADHLHFTVIYLSNAEETVPHLGRLAINLAALPHSDATLILRTFFDAPQPAADGLWTYQIQPLTNFLHWLRQPEIHTLQHLQSAFTTAKATIPDPHHVGLSWVTPSVLPSPP